MTSVACNGHQEHRAGIAAFMDASLYDALSVLIRQLYSGSSDPTVHVVMFTAANAQSGVSYLSSCIATLVAKQFGTTLLANGETLVAFAERGHLPTRQDCSQVKDRLLWVLGAARPHSAMSADLRSHVSITAVIASLAHEFDFVIIDAPAISKSDIAESLAPHVDGSVLIVVPDVTEVSEITNARIKLTAQGGHLFGAIYNSSQGGPSKEDA